ncbi:MAG: hypothetical protein QOK04_1014, partial [Solirubrobacteraceae bacterium]|nr:hypothetical protein [Solirubrobacteraceae bacterium]
YDSSIVTPLNVVSLAAGPSPGVVVLDMSDPARPVRTALLTELPMLAPHESLNLNTRRGLLAANLGSGTTLPGLMSIYDVRRDCPHPVLDATYQAARFGHESGFSLDGNTYWIGGGDGIAAVDVSDPKQPRTLWDGNVYAHGLNVRDDGNRLYDSDPINGNLVILDVSQIQARKPQPVVREVSRLTWDPVSVPQNTAPMEIGGRPYLLEFDEFGFRFSTISPPDTVGAARIIDITHETRPRVVSDLRLAVNMPAAHKEADADPSPLPQSQFTYAGHYCAIPREIDPEIAACSFINSGLRIFNIQDPAHPREVAYYISPPSPANGSGGGRGDFAISQPAFDPARREVWYSDATTGFYNLRLDESAWPHPLSPPKPHCPTATGRLSGSSLGPVTLGQTRAAIRRRLGRFSTRGSIDLYCLAGGDISVGYPSAKLLRSLSRRQRKRVLGRAVLVLTANDRYALLGVRSGARLATVARRLHLQGGNRIGTNTWYLLPGRAANGVLRVRRGVVEEIGIVDRALTGNGRRVRTLLASFS